MNPMLLIDGRAIAITAVIIIAARVLYHRLPDRRERSIAVGSLVQTLTLGAGILVAVNMLAKVGSPAEMGPHLAVSLLVPLYGVMANIAFTFHARFGKRIRAH